MAGVDWVSVRRQCARQVEVIERAVGIPDPWSVNVFLDALERFRGRDVDLCAVSWTPGESTGAWACYPDHDVIAYAANTSPLHQDMIILHEVGHLLFAHRGRCLLAVDDVQRLAPDLRPAAFVHLLDRAQGVVEEHEAEMLATLILRRVATRRSHASAGVGTDLVGRIHAAFG